IYNECLIAGTLKVLRREHGKPVDESAVGIWLDEIYEGEVAEEWKAEFSKTAQEFEAAIVNTLRPFQSDYALRRQFYEAFDGVDVLPDDDWEKYDSLHKLDPLKARELLVSISYGRLKQLQGKRLAWEEEGGWPIVVAVPYSRELGLDFSNV
ncbi:MAG: CRISPR-associated helicase/endonuclease Cas3, partial [Anaerolineales bacterium]